MTRLQAMQLHMMGFGSAEPSERAVPRFQRPAPAPQATKAAETIVALRTALAAERKARLAAEARLRNVLAHVAASARRPTRAAPPPPPPDMISTPLLPAAQEVIEIEGEVVDPGDALGAMRAAIMDDGEDDGEENYNG